MRILQVANGFPHRAYGGVELHTHQLCLALARRGHEVAVFTRHSDTAATDGDVVDDVVDGLRVRSVVNDFKGYDFVHHYLCTPVRDVFARTLAELRPDIVHVQHLLGLSADLPEVARALDIRTVATVHEYWYACQRVMLQFADGSPCAGPAHASCIACVLGPDGHPPSPSLASRLAVEVRRLTGGVRALGPQQNRHRFRALRAALESYQGVVTPSRFVIDELARQGMPLRNATAIPLGVDTGAFSEPQDVPAPPIDVTRPLRLGFIGQLLGHKGPHTLLQAMRSIPGLPVRLDLHGRRWPDRAYDRVLAPLLEAEPRAHHHGQFPDGALPHLLASLDVLVVPSTCPESFGIAIREAHLAARPVLSTDRGALPESIEEGVNGLLVPGEDPAAMAAAITRLVNEPGLLARLLEGARRARGRVKSMDTYAAEIERELYAWR